MQPQVEFRSVQSSGVSAAGAFGMKAENSAHIFGILRNQLYSNKVLAVLREYSANAWDEHRAAGIPDRPIKVVLPTALEPTLRIRDYGRGLSEEDVFDVYTQYGSSTKRQSDDVVGCLGIGSKSAFAYADTFTVTSWHGGQKSVYVAVLDESNIGTMSLLWRCPCDPSETGVEVSMPVQAADCAAFRREAEGLYPYFTPVPDINLPINRIDFGNATHGVINTGGQHRGWIGIMGCIPYIIDTDQMHDALFDTNLNAIARANIVLRFDIGEVSIAASREALEYTTRTKEAIVRRVQALIAELHELIVRTASDDAVDPWTRRVRISKYFGIINCLGQFDDTLRWISPSVNLYNSIRTVFDSTRIPTSFDMRRLHRYSSKPLEFASDIRVHADARIIIRDVNRSVSCYNFTLVDRIIYPRTGFTIDAVRAELDACIAGVDLTGIPVVLLSSLPYTPKARNTTKTSTATPDAKMRHFVLNPLESFRYRANNPSRDWSAVNRTPTADDLFVILEGFVPMGMDRGYRIQFASDMKLAMWLGITFPPIYGYRTSVKHPVTESACVGRHYPDVRKDVLRTMLDANPERRAELERYAWSRAQSSLGGRGRVPELRKAVQVLAADHPVRVLVERIDEAMRWEGWNTSEACVYKDDFDGIVTFEAETALNAVFDRYPHLNRNNDGPGLYGLTRPLWIEYINLIDKVNS